MGRLIMQRKITGTLYSYYFVCKRKLWYSAHNIDMEQESDNVLIGRLIDENSYVREDKSILIDSLMTG
jgi:CRISPR-associated exonuclease Cas4